MKTAFIKNKFGDILAVHILEYDFETDDVKNIVDLIRKYGVVFWKRTNLSLDTYYKWQLKLGYHHQHENAWCSNDQYSIFFRVTNRYIKPNYKGFFEDSEVNWHSEILFAPEAEELVGLFAQIAPKGSKTFFANTIPYWKNLDNEKRSLFENLWIKITDNIEDTYDKTSAHHYFLRHDLDNWRRKRDIRKSINFEGRFCNLYKAPRFSRHLFLKLVPRHPLGVKGIYFPHLNISSIVDSSKQQRSDHREIYEEIKEEYILSERYVYPHEWEAGDIVLSDQLTGVHKRNNIWKTTLEKEQEERELLRSICWYKTEERKHFDYSL